MSFGFQALSFSYLLTMMFYIILTIFYGLVREIFKLSFILALGIRTIKICNQKKKKEEEQKTIID